MVAFGVPVPKWQKPFLQLERCMMAVFWEFQVIIVAHYLEMRKNITDPYNESLLVPLKTKV